MVLKKAELENIYGGKNKWSIGIVIGILGTFFAGVIDGYFRPLRCN